MNIRGAEPLRLGPCRATNDGSRGAVDWCASRLTTRSRPAPQWVDAPLIVVEQRADCQQTPACDSRVLNGEPCRAGRARDGLRVFHRKGKPTDDLRKTWASACKAAGLEGRLVHDLRGIAARDFRVAGCQTLRSCGCAGGRPVICLTGTASSTTPTSHGPSRPDSAPANRVTTKERQTNRWKAPRLDS